MSLMRVDIKIQLVPIDKGPSCSMVSGFTIKDATSTHHHICCVFHSGSLWNVFDLPPYNKVCHRLSAYRWFSSCITVSSANNTDTLIYTVGDVLCKHFFNFQSLENKR
jgi:hypothetical protein